MFQGNRSEDSCSGCSIVTNGIFEDPLAVEICTGAPSYTTSPGARDTVASLVLDSGYWRSSNTSVNISECYNDNACLGGVSDYCAPGYTGPCEMQLPGTSSRYMADLSKSLSS